MGSPRPDEGAHNQIGHAVGILAGGGVIAIPTDTLYGLAASVDRAVAVERVFRLKGRPKGMALPLLLADADGLEEYVSEVPDLAWALVDRFWPGPLTLVLSRSDRVPAPVCGGGDTVALRVPDHCVPRSLVRSLRAPITGTSANRTGQPGLTTAGAVRSEFGDELDLVVEGRATTLERPSTVVDLSMEEPRILRQGAVSRREIEEGCGRPIAI